MDMEQPVLRRSEEQIATGARRPGTRLDEQDPGAEFGVSRTPIREALIQLAAVGLVEMRLRRGAIVADVGPARLCEMFELMAEQASALHRRLRPYRRLRLRVRNRMQTSYAEHQAIVDAVLAGDGERAAEAPRSHVTVQRERFADLVASLALLKEGHPGSPGVTRAPNP